VSAGPHPHRHSVALLGALLAGALVARAASADSPAFQPAPAYPQPPEVLFKDLFVAVQTAAIYPDGKTFADAVPDAAPQVILSEYHAAHPDSPAALRRFTDAHFLLPAAPATAAAAPASASAGPTTAARGAAGLEAHIDGLWSRLTRDTPVVPPYGSLLPLPKPYVVPGGRFREIYYWDSYFTMLGLVESGRRDLVADMMDDFAHLIDTYGHVPNGTRTYYLSRSQPPFFFEMVGLLASGGTGDARSHYLRELRREYAFWMAGAEGLRPGEARRRVVAMPDGAILNRYWDDRDSPRAESYAQDVALARASGRPPAQIYREIRAAAESGWDFSSRWFADAHTLGSIDTTEIAPVDLNSLLFGLENAIRAACELEADVDCAREFARRAAARHAAVDRYLWSAPTGAYLDYRWTRRTPVPGVSAATLYPLFVQLASPAQAAAVAATTRRQLLEPGGVVTTPIRTGQQWDAPNGWAPLQWIAIAGLRHYRQDALAATVACRWLVNVRQVYRASGKLVEKYDVVTTGRPGGGGEYPAQDGFGWTNGVTRRLMVLYPQAARAERCRE
jgi:alpha,alpha-trehalase